MFIPSLQVSHILLCPPSYRYSGANQVVLHEEVFVPSIQGQGTPEQQDKWLPLAKDYKIIGAYAQTELGHGAC